MSCLIPVGQRKIKKIRTVKNRMGKSSVYVVKKDFEQIINKLYQENGLVMKIALETGLRVTDVLNLRIGDLRQNKRIRVVEGKTGKTKWIYIPAKLRNEILQTRSVGQHDGYYVFPSRCYPLTKHRSRQAVWKDMKRVLKDYCFEFNCSPHSSRKIYAVNKYRESGDLEKVQALLNHDYKSTTLLYALADLI